MIDEEIKVLKVTSGVSKDKTRTWVTIKYECLNRMLIFGEKHLNYKPEQAY